MKLLTTSINILLNSDPYVLISDLYGIEIRWRVLKCAVFIENYSSVLEPIYVH